MKLGIELSAIGCMADAIRVRNALVERGVRAIVTQPAASNDCRVFVAEASFRAFRVYVADSTIELIN